MEEQRTRRALDELADLFLTGPAGGPPRPADTDADADRTTTVADAGAPADAVAAAAQAAADASAAVQGASDGASADHEPGDELSQLDGPEPIRLPPKPTASRGSLRYSDLTRTGAVSGAPRRPASNVADDDGFATEAPAGPALRLHREEAAVDEPGPTARRPKPAPFADAPATVEATLLGNLPGLSGPWLTQYAQRLAQQDGPVLLLHLDDEHIDVELVEPTGRPQAPHRAAPRAEVGDDLVDQLESLVRSSAAPVRRVLVHVSASPQPMVLARLRSIDVWTVLTGADDAAIMAAQRLLKRMIETDPAATPQRIGLMLMGSDEPTCQRAARRLRSAATGLLDAPIEAVGCQRQLAPVNLRQIGRFGPTETVWPALRRWLASLDPAEPGRSVMEAGDDRSDDRSTDDPCIDDRSEADAPPPDDEPPRGNRSSDDRSIDDRSEAPPDQRSADDRSAPAADQRSVADRSIDQHPDLAGFLTRASLAGGVALEARCPHQPDTQLLLDQAGRLHLLRRHAPASAAADSQSLDVSDDTAALRAAVVDLLEARAWVREHHSLLALTQRQCRFDGDAEPTLHLFTHRADMATALAARLGPALKLHLLQQITAGQQRTWFSTPLS